MIAKNNEYSIIWINYVFIAICKSLRLQCFILLVIWMDNSNCGCIDTFDILLFFAILQNYLHGLLFSSYVMMNTACGWCQQLYLYCGSKDTFAIFFPPFYRDIDMICCACCHRWWARVSLELRPRRRMPLVTVPRTGREGPKALVVSDVWWQVRSGDSLETLRFAGAARSKKLRSACGLRWVAVKNSNERLWVAQMNASDTESWHYQQDFPQVASTD